LDGELLGHLERKTEEYVAQGEAAPGSRRIPSNIFEDE